ncbi:transporter [Ameyamaea chiangmaiensis NBRC 103196]|uniref:AI-2E family transporter n=1 Tax=Ameyamaea chiangmaiensis TaxID=442969 RepID=A0A850PAV8_9PROT|nr:AI-2E family transporter [Ameyamaea chiangmaiensis]MBS4073680.1 AI-2E family transporter [Ameyamaea chiangmaiensis]NVN39052.1 AI-2E family transporter [Ameyamaea chiangmaiensis]GBQ68832.1 transporter [Ameyamaea chiangmaiensis NBRC 103196]
MIERIMMGILIGAVAYGCFLVLSPFVSAILWAAILSFVTWPVFTALRKRVRPVVAALILTVICALGIVLPLVLITSAAIADAPDTIETVSALFSQDLRLPPLPDRIAHMPLLGHAIETHWTRWGNDLGALGQTMEPYAGRIARSGLVILMQVANGALHLVMALFIAFFFWLSGDGLGATSAAVIRRIAGPYGDRLLRLISSTVKGTVYGILGTAIVQGLLTGLALALAGFPGAVLLGALAAFLSVLPIGAPIVWAPAAIWLVATHHLVKGILLALFGVVAISGADHIIRPMFIARGAQLPYLLTVLGVLGGVVAFGGLGIFLGPVLLGLGYTLISEFAAHRTAVGARR